jgi:hypothetical protein
MGAKRQITQKQTRGGKKAKLDPVSAKVKEIVDALERDDCEVGGPPSFREGLVAAFPSAMGLGAAKDERHAYQDKVGDIVLEILQTTQAKFQASHKAVEAEFAAAEGVKATKGAELTAAEAALEESTKKESEARDTHLSSVDAVTDAQKKLDEASSEVDSFDANQLEKGKERAEIGSALEAELAALKNGTVEDAKEKKTLLSTVNAALVKVGVDKALISAAAPALTKAPSSRGPFDTTVVDQVESALKTHADSLQQDLDNGDSVKAMKVAAQTAAKEALTAAETKEAEDKVKVSEAETQTKDSKAALKQAKESLKEQEKLAHDVGIKVFYEETHLANFTDAIKALEFLQGRESTSPEAEPEKVLEADVTMGEVNAVVA